MYYTEYEQTLLGTKVTLTLTNENEHLAKFVFSAINKLEDKLSIYRDYSEIMSINKFAGIQPVNVSPFIFNLIKQAKSISLGSDSYFNIAIGPLVKLWKKACADEKLPLHEKITGCLPLVNSHLILLDEKNHTVFLEKKGMEIDLGSIAKGYIADVIKKILITKGTDSAIINLGGNVLTLGHSARSLQGFWEIGLQTPFSKRNEYFASVKIKNQSVVTSGIYERYCSINNKRYHHLLNPKTGYPLDNDLISVSVIAQSSIEADTYSTYFYGLGLEKSVAYLKKHASISAIFVNKNHEIHIANFMPSYFTLKNHNFTIKYQ